MLKDDQSFILRRLIKLCTEMDSLCTQLQNEIDWDPSNKFLLLRMEHIAPCFTVAVNELRDAREVYNANQR